MEDAECATPAMTPPKETPRQKRLRLKEERRLLGIEKSQKRRKIFMESEDGRANVSAAASLRTFGNVNVQIIPAAQREIEDGPYESKIQDLISALANGERPSNFEKLYHIGEFFSMRLSKKERLIITIDAHDGDNITALTILSAAGTHYKGVDSRYKTTVAPQAVGWSAP